MSTIQGLLDETWFQEVKSDQPRNWLDADIVRELQVDQVSTVLSAYAAFRSLVLPVTFESASIEVLTTGRYLLNEDVVITADDLAAFLNALTLAEHGWDGLLEMPAELREHQIFRDARELGMSTDEYRRLLLWWSGDNRRRFSLS